MKRTSALTAHLERTNGEEEANKLAWRLGVRPGDRWSDILTLVEHVYQKPLHFVRMEPNGIVTGLWVDTDDFGAVICRGNAKGKTNEHVILHELTHILVDHHSSAGISASEERIEQIAFAIARLMHADPMSDEEAHFG